MLIEFDLFGRSFLRLVFHRVEAIEVPTEEPGTVVAFGFHGERSEPHRDTRYDGEEDEE